MAEPASLEELFGPAKAPAEEAGGGGDFHAAFLDFISAYEANDLESAETAFKQAVQACYAGESMGDEMPPV